MSPKCLISTSLSYYSKLTHLLVMVELVSVGVCRCDAEARAERGSVRGVPLLQASHPEGSD